MKKNFIYLVLVFKCLDIFSQTIPMHTIDFEQADVLIINPSSQLWQVGHPQKSIFNAAHSGNKVIVTDTINNYPVSANSSFTVIAPFGSYYYNWVCLSCISFWHKYDIDTTGGDKGIMEFSVDNGQNWYLMKDTFPWNCNSVYGEMGNWLNDYHAATNSFSVHPLYTKGSSNGWIKSQYCWQWLIPVFKLSNSNSIATSCPPSDTVLIRFKFVSDSIAESKEGWMIDDITLDIYSGVCSSVEEYSSDNTINIFPQPAKDFIFIISKQKLNEAKLEISDISGKVIYSQRFDNFSNIKLPVSNLLESGIYFLNISNQNKVERKIFVIQK